MRPLQRIAVLLLGALCGPLAAAPDAEVIVKLTRAVLKVSALGDEDNLAIGSAVVIGPDTALTNCHVTQHAHTIVLSRGLERHKVVGQRADISRDLCMLRTERVLPYPPADIRPARTLTLGENVLAHGYSGGMEPQFARGIVLDLHAAGGSHVIQTTAGFIRGASGGGLFDRSGRLVGITTFLTATRRPAYFAVPADWAERLRERPELPPAPLPGAALWAQLPVSQPWFMRMLEPLAREDWQALTQFAEEWVAAEPHAPAAHLMCARAAHAVGDASRRNDCVERALHAARNDEIELLRIAVWAKEAGLKAVSVAADHGLSRLRPTPRPE